MVAKRKEHDNRSGALNEQTARTTLARIARDVEPICRRFNLRYAQLGASSDRSLYGFNRESGTIIRIRLHNLRTGKLRKYSALVATMLHELCHCQYANHSRPFYDLLNDVTEYAKKLGIYQPSRKQ